MSQEGQHPVEGGASRSARSGAMTSVMKAIAASEGRKVLRIGVVEKGKVTDERLLRENPDVTVGPTEKSTFVVATHLVPPNFKLFERVGDRYVLNFLDGVTGRLALETGIADLAELKPTAKVLQRHGVRTYQIPLSDTARGKVAIGTATFLFQFVAAPIAQARPQLPLSVKSGVGIDWQTTVIAAFSFLFHFGLIGSIYSDWLDPVIDENVNVSQIVEAVGQLPPPPVSEKDPVEATTGKEIATSAPATKPAAHTNAGGATHAAGGAKSHSVENAQIGNELAQLDVRMLGVLNADGINTGKVLENDQLAVSLIDGAAANGAGAGHGNGLNMGMGQGFRGRPGEGGGNGLLGHDGRADGPVDAGHAHHVEGPHGTAFVSPPQQHGGSVANAAQVIGSLSGAFRRCYEQGLATNADMEGTFTITARIGPAGEVLGASPSGGGGISGAVQSCAAGHVGGVSFSPPEGGGATLIIPVGMKHQ